MYIIHDMGVMLYHVMLCYSISNNYYAISYHISLYHIIFYDIIWNRGLRWRDSRPRRVGEVGGDLYIHIHIHMHIHIQIQIHIHIHTYVYTHMHTHT